MARVLVTGSNSGIGLETALSFARSGHSVYATVRNLDRAATLLQHVGTEKLPVSAHGSSGMFLGRLHSHFLTGATR